MAYQFENTNTAKDAVFMCESALKRLRQYGDYADEIVNTSTHVADTVAAVKRDGLLHIPDFFECQQILAMGAELEQKIVSRLSGMKVRNHRAEQLSDMKTMDIHHVTLSESATLSEAKKYTTGISLPDPLINMPSIIDLLGYKRLLDIVIGYYESVPLLTFAKMRYAFVNSIGPADTQHWHADPGSFRVLKALIYLNDVDENGGPFEYILGSHKQKFPNWSQHTRHDEAELHKIYPAENFKVCTAKAGDILLAEVSGFHRGQPPIAADRRILILNFCVNREYGLPYESIKVRSADIKKTQGLHRAIFDDVRLV